MTELLMIFQLQRKSKFREEHLSKSTSCRIPVICSLITCYVCLCKVISKKSWTWKFIFKLLALLKYPKMKAFQNNQLYGTEMVLMSLNSAISSMHAL